MHIGSYDEEPLTVEKMHAYMEEQGYELDITEERFHHEIYLSDPRRTSEENLRLLYDIRLNRFKNHERQTRKYELCIYPEMQ